MLFKTSLYREFPPWLTNIGPPAFRRKVLEFLPSRVAKEACELVDSLTSHSTAIFEHQKSSLEKDDDEVQRQVGAGKDIMSVLRKFLSNCTLWHAWLMYPLVRANVEASQEDKLPDDELLGQMS